jgi:hypothetical protein
VLCDRVITGDWVVSRFDQIEFGKCHHRRSTANLGKSCLADLPNNRTCIRDVVGTSLSVKQFMANSEGSPRLIGQVVRANRDIGHLRGLLNSNRPVSLIR